MGLGRVPKRDSPKIRKLEKRMLKVCGEYPGARAARKGQGKHLTKNCRSVLKRYVKARKAAGN